MTEWWLSLDLLVIDSWVNGDYCQICIHKTSLQIKFVLVCAIKVVDKIIGVTDESFSASRDINDCFLSYWGLISEGYWWLNSKLLVIDFWVIGDWFLNYWRLILDIDECSTGSPCSHGCLNVPGTFKCTCPRGYRLIGGTLCRGESVIIFVR